jgi:hypothetical protein
VRAPLLLAVPLVALVAGCAASAGPAASGTTTAPVTASTSCGVVTLAQGDTTGVPESALTCFTMALADQRRVTLTVTQPTVEGDPVTTVFTALLGQHVQVDVDSSKDAFAGMNPKVSRQVCTGASVADGRLLLAGCQDLATPDPAAT